jgi:hypothetical protein
VRARLPRSSTGKGLSCGQGCRDRPQVRESRAGKVAGMTPVDIMRALETRFDGLVVKQSWGESSLFYNPGQALAHGIYFVTVKEHDGAHDTASALDRDGVFRVSFGLPAASYERLFGARPSRPAKGQHVDTGHDFTCIDELMPHPVYAWMGWVQVLSPTEGTFLAIRPLIEQAYAAAQEKFARRVS